MSEAVSEALFLLGSIAEDAESGQAIQDSSKVCRNPKLSSYTKVYSVIYDAGSVPE